MNPAPIILTIWQSFLLLKSHSPPSRIDVRVGPFVLSIEQSIEVYSASQTQTAFTHVPCPLQRPGQRVLVKLVRRSFPVRIASPHSACIASITDRVKLKPPVSWNRAKEETCSNFVAIRWQKFDLSIDVWKVFQDICLPIDQCVCMSAFLSFCLSVCLSFCLPACLSVYAFICMSVY